MNTVTKRNCEKKNDSVIKKEKINLLSSETIWLTGRENVNSATKKNNPQID